MCDQIETDRIIKRMEEFGENCTKEKAKEFLISAGIIDEEGNLTEPYKSV